jgi:hypothetical protein
MTISKLRFTFFTATLLLGGIAFASVIQPVSAQTVSPIPSPTVTPNPTIIALENRIGTLEADVSLLDDRKDVDKQSLQNDVQKTLLPVYIWFAVLSALGVSSAVGAWTWYKNFMEKTQKQVEEETRKKLDQAFYNADPLYYPLYAPDDDEFKVERKRLAKLGFRDIRLYGGLRPSILNGIVIFRVPGKNFEISEDRAHAESALNALEDFMIQNEFEKKKTAFVLYIAGSGRLPKANEFAAKYDNIVIANMPVTIAEHIYALVRGLTAPDSKKEAE